MNEEKAPRETGQVILGVLLAIGLHLLQVPLMVLGFGSFALVGVTQLVYLLPAIFMARRAGKQALMKGLIIGGALTFLLNAACFGIVIFVLSTMH